MKTDEAPLWRGFSVKIKILVSDLFTETSIVSIQSNISSIQSCCFSIQTCNPSFQKMFFYYPNIQSSNSNMRLSILNFQSRNSEKIVSSASKNPMIFLFQYVILYRKPTTRQFNYTIRQFKQAFCRQKHAILHFETIVLQFQHSTIQTGNSSIPTLNLLGQICCSTMETSSCLIW